MNILIVDDDGDKIKNVVKAIAETGVKVSVDTRQDLISAVQIVATIQYHIIIVDLQLPTRKGDNPDPEGGKNLVAEIYRRNGCILPYFIIGLTQYSDIKDNFSKLWNTLVYNNNEEWKSYLHMAIKHTNRIINQPSILKRVNVPTIYVEGETDYNVLQMAFELYNPVAREKINIGFQRSAGASWVKNQLVAWAHLLNRDISEEYLQAVGLLDGDSAGQNAINEINRLIKSDSAASKTFSTIKLSPKYNDTLKSIYGKGLRISVTLEELFKPEIWALGESHNLLEPKHNLDEYLKSPRSWDKMNQSLSDYIKSLNLSKDERLYLNKFSMKGKVKIFNLLRCFSLHKQRELLSNFELLVQDLVQKLKI